MNRINITNDTLKLILRIIIIFPIYQLILIIIGTIFGEFRYFWSFQKRFLKKISFKKKVE